MRIYSKQNVYEAAIERINYLYDEFDNVVVSFSGGKDSTVVLEMALEVARKRNRLPVPVLFIDQEAEWQGTVDYVKEVMYRKEVKPYWYQMPIVITNNASSTSRYHQCWNEEEKEDWLHPQDDISIKENKYGTDRFHDLFTAIAKVDFPENTCYLAGVRTEEAPKRYMALTSSRTYKHITWGKYLDKKRGQYTFYPLYDWSYTDIWKYIHVNAVNYNKVYDDYYRHGVRINDMRISNLHHETALKSLTLVQEIEPETWNKIAKKIDGANTIKHIQKNSFTCPKELPYMFEDWKEYALHLADNLIFEDNLKDLLKRKLESQIFYDVEPIRDAFWRIIINTILSSDFDFTKYQNWTLQPNVDTWRRVCKNPYGEDKVKHKWVKPMTISTKYLTQEEKLRILNYFKDGKHK